MSSLQNIVMTLPLYYGPSKERRNAMFNVSVTVDMAQIARDYAQHAIDNVNGKSRAMGGAVIISTEKVT